MGNPYQFQRVGRCCLVDPSRFFGRCEASFAYACVGTKCMSVCQSACLSVCLRPSLYPTHKFRCGFENLDNAIHVLDIIYENNLLTIYDVYSVPIISTSTGYDSTHYECNCVCVCISMHLKNTSGTNIK